MALFRTPQIVLFSRDLPAAAAFYRAVGFGEVFRTPTEGGPIHVDLELDGYRIGLAARTPHATTTASTRWSAVSGRR